MPFAIWNTSKNILPWHTWWNPMEKMLRVLLALAEWRMLRQELRDITAAPEGPTGESPEAPQQGFSCTGFTIWKCWLGEILSPGATGRSCCRDFFESGQEMPIRKGHTMAFKTGMAKIVQLQGVFCEEFRTRSGHHQKELNNHRKHRQSKLLVFHSFYFCTKKSICTRTWGSCQLLKK
jgi:hypothetical protein